MPDILPCPFCGGTNLSIDCLSEGDDWSVEREDCHVGQHAIHLSESRAIAAWNRRSLIESRQASIPSDQRAGASPAPLHQVVGQTFSPNGETCPHCGKDECCGGFMAVNIVMEKRNREELLGIADRLRERLAARVRFLESRLRDCLSHIDLLEGHLPIANAEDESVYKESISFGERIAACLPNPTDHQAPASGALVHPVVRCEP